MKEHNWKKIIQRAVLAGAISVTLSFFICMLLSVFVEEEWLSIHTGQNAAVLILGALLFTACYWTAMKCPKQKLLQATVTAVSTIVFVLTIKLVVLQSAVIRMNGKMVVPFLAAAGGGMVAGMKRKRYR